MKHKSRSNRGGNASEEAEIDVREFIDALINRKWIMLGCIAGTLTLGLIYILKTPVTYSATTVVQVEQEESKFVNIEDINSEDLKQLEILKTIEANLASSSLLLGVIDSMNLTPNELGLKPKDDGTPYSDAEKVVAFSNMINVKLVRGTRLIDVTASAFTPLLAEQIADEIPKEYTRINTAARAGLAGEANKFLLEQADVLEHQVQIAEEEAQEFKDKHPGVDLDDTQDFFNQKLLALNAKLNDARERLFRLQADNALAQEILSGTGNGDKFTALMKIGSVSADPAVLQLEAIASAAKENLAQVAKRYRPKHPNYIQAVAQMAAAQSDLDAAVIRTAEGLSTGVTAAQTTERNFEDDVKVAEATKLANDKVAIPYGALQREVEANRGLYDDVKMRLKETEITRDIGSNEIRIATPAMLPLHPSKPRRTLTLMASLVGGFILGCCVCFGMSIFDTSFSSVHEVELALELPGLVAIPEFKKMADNKRFLITLDPAGAIAESFRTLRVSLSIENGDTDQNIILFTSSVPGEGKTFCAANCAISLAQLGQPTLIIDADLRLPTIAETLLAVEPKIGLDSVLTGASTLADAVRSVPNIPNLDVLPASTRVLNPAEILSGPGLRKMLREAAERYQWVVIDSPPVLAVSDALLMVKYVKSVCLVIQADKTPARMVQQACDLIQNAKAKPLGFILNRIAPRGSSYYYYSYSGKYGQYASGDTEHPVGKDLRPQGK